jgi:hypothetical protein
MCAINGAVGAPFSGTHELHPVLLFEFGEMCRITLKGGCHEHFHHFHPIPLIDHRASPRSPATTGARLMRLTSGESANQTSVSAPFSGRRANRWPINMATHEEPVVGVEPGVDEAWVKQLAVTAVPSRRRANSAVKRMLASHQALGKLSVSRGPVGQECHDLQLTAGERLGSNGLCLVVSDHWAAE